MSHDDKNSEPKPLTAVRERLDENAAIDAKDAARYRALRDSGIAVSAWQDVDGVHWAVNGVEYMNLDDGADTLIKRLAATRDDDMRDQLDAAAEKFMKDMGAPSASTDSKASKP